jgi:DNA-binding NarL/FixJ family response regulator
MKGHLQLLTPRERDVVACLWKGHCNKLIARELQISEGTVKVHLVNIFAKMDVRNRAALIATTLMYKDALESALHRATIDRARARAQL